MCLRNQWGIIITSTFRPTRLCPVVVVDVVIIIVVVVVVVAVTIVDCNSGIRLG